MISHGVDVNATNKTNVTALMLACASENKDAMNVLLNAGADPNIADADGDTSLHYAALNDCCVEDLQAIINHGVDVNAINKNRQTAYMLACHQGNIDAMRVLLSADADPSIVSNDGDTNLHSSDDGCSSNMRAQTVMQWLHTTWRYVDLPVLDITESLGFNLLSYITCNMMRHVIYNRR